MARANNSAARGARSGLLFARRGARIDTPRLCVQACGLNVSWDRCRCVGLVIFFFFFFVEIALFPLWCLVIPLISITGTVRSHYQWSMCCENIQIFLANLISNRTGHDQYMRFVGGG